MRYEKLSARGKTGSQAQAKRRARSLKRETGGGHGKVLRSRSGTGKGRALIRR